MRDVLYQVVRDHYETFRTQAASIRDGAGLPRFVEQAAFARSASASHAVASAEAGVWRVAALRVPGPSTTLRAIPSHVEGWRAASRVAIRRATPKPWRRRAAWPVFDVPAVAWIGSCRSRARENGLRELRLFDPSSASGSP
jgi:hypothetical protein